MAARCAAVRHGQPADGSESDCAKMPGGPVPVPPASRTLVAMLAENGERTRDMMNIFIKLLFDKRLSLYDIQRLVEL